MLSPEEFNVQYFSLFLKLVCVIQQFYPIFIIHCQHSFQTYSPMLLFDLFGCGAFVSEVKLYI